MAPAPPVDDPAQLLEEIWRTLNLVEDYEVVCVVLQIEARTSSDEVSTRSRCEVYVVRRGPVLRDLLGERRLTNLPWAEQDHGGHPLQAGGDRLREPAVQHARNTGRGFPICKAKRPIDATTGCCRACAWGPGRAWSRASRAPGSAWD